MANQIPLILNSSTGVIERLSSNDTLCIPTKPPLLRITTNTSYYVATTGNDTNDGSSATPWATLEHALRVIGSYWIDAGVTVTVYLADGKYTSTTRLTYNNPTAGTINITGTHTYSCNITSVQSAGLGLYVLNVDSNANIAEDDYVLIKNATGGTNPQVLQGCHRVQGTPTNQITIEFARMGGVVATGAVSATVTVLKTQLYWSTGHGMWFTSALGSIDKLAIVGSAYNNGYAGLALSQNGHVTLSSSCGITKWQYGVLETSGGSVALNGSVITACTYGMYAWMTNNFETVTLPYITACVYGFYLVGSSLQFSSTHFIYCDYGAYCTASVYILTGVLASYNGTALYARRGSMLSGASGVSFTSNTTDTNPALDTEGNILSYIIS